MQLHFHPCAYIMLVNLPMCYTDYWGVTRYRVDQGSGRSPRNRAPLRPMVEVSKSLKLRHTTMVSVLSYNLLAQSLLEKNMELYDRQYPQYLDWDFRKAGLLRELQLSSSDVSLNVAIVFVPKPPRSFELEQLV